MSLYLVIAQSQSGTDLSFLDAPDYQTAAKLTANRLATGLSINNGKREEVTVAIIAAADAGTIIPDADPGKAVLPPPLTDEQAAERKATQEKLKAAYAALLTLADDAANDAANWSAMDDKQRAEATRAAIERQAKTCMVLADVILNNGDAKPDTAALATTPTPLDKK